jgi:decaprenylphospho-beta-D-ribofuranose 2-oxidase
MLLRHELPRRVFDGFGRASIGLSVFVKPTTTEELQRSLERAANEGIRVAFRGNGRSYGDAALNTGQLVIDMTAMDKVLSWDGETGVLEAQPGLTINQLWQHCLADGWWPPVVPGTSWPTLGGCVAMNIHGKNHYKMGGFGDHVLELDLLTPAGERLLLSREDNPELFHGVLGGFGMLGCVTRVKLQMKKVHGGRLIVRQWALPTLSHQFDAWEHCHSEDYFVSWTDCLGFGSSQAGRSQMHSARYVQPGQDDEGAMTLHRDAQKLPGSMMGVPAPLVPLVLKVFYSHNELVRLMNTAKYTASYYGSTAPFFQSHAGFHFLLDQLPGFREAYGPGGFIQFQPFVPKDSAQEVFAEIIRVGKRRDLPSYLGVVKRYRPDDFLLSHALDGYSLALDFRVTASNRQALWQTCRELADLVLDAGGKFYPAKDLILRADQFRRAFGQERITAFRNLRQRVDPDRLLRTDLAERLGIDEPE